MSDKVISLSPKMQRRLNFRHELFDEVDAYKLDEAEVGDTIFNWLQFGRREDRDSLILGFMWLAKDVVSRFRGHWPETHHMTDDLCSEGLVVLTKFVDELDSGENFFNQLQAKLCNDIRDYINDNRSLAAASRQTNIRRQAADKPLEYNFAERFNDAFNGRIDDNFGYVDILDTVEKLAETDREELQTLILQFLEHDHDINEASLSDEERAAIERLSAIGKDLL